MPAPNLRAPEQIFGKTAVVGVTTTSSAVLTNPSLSDYILKVNSVYCSNIDGTSAADITLTCDINGSVGHIAKTITVPADATQVLVTKEAYIYLEQNSSLNAQASANNDLELVISYEVIGSGFGLLG